MVRGGAEGRVVETGPPKDGKARGHGLGGKGREMTREVVFSEGRGFRARVARPEASRGITRSRRGKRTPGGHEKATLGLTLCRHRGRAEPAPPRGAIQGKMASRGKAGNNVEGGFLGGTHSVRPRGKAGGGPGHNTIKEG